MNIEVAPHNPAMDALQPQMRSELADLTPRTPTIPIISTTYENLDTRPAFDAEHWATNMRNPVRFQQAIARAGAQTFIEISAHPLLTQAIADTLEAARPEPAIYANIGTLQRDTDDTVTFRTNLYTALDHPPQTPHPPEPHPAIPATRGNTPATGSPQRRAPDVGLPTRSRRPDRCAPRTARSTIGATNWPGRLARHRTPRRQTPHAGSWWQMPDCAPKCAAPPVRTLGWSSWPRRRWPQTAIRAHCWKRYATWITCSTHRRSATTRLTLPRPTGYSTRREGFPPR
ncbi:hypothetical protein NIIDMKKI_50050 [Mycobacterium kansasii]|uniref:Malonyl-CoA:ACP transacylase (MAT) domain-containing protein n=1 Tax=Mycobacterium kansasii TaxID=1768 RepID=A0A7G1IJ29_MYCKA|nr:hypothetical protein NIIDMKKI_50050 [Mycobacterium kansasii]